MLYRVCFPKLHRLFSTVGELMMVSCFLLDNRSNVIKVSNLGQDPRRYPAWYNVVQTWGVSIDLNLHHLFRGEIEIISLAPGQCG